MSLELRRREMMQAEDNYLKGWTKGYRIANNGNLTPYATFIASPHIPIPAGTERIEVYQPTKYDEPRNVFCLFYADGTRQDYYFNYGPNWRVRQATLPSGVTEINVSFLIADVDDCYIKNVYTGEYIWKGKNVE